MSYSFGISPPHWCYSIRRCLIDIKQLVIVVLAFVLVTCGLVLYRGEFDSWQVRDILNLLTPMLFAYVVQDMSLR